MSAINSTVFPIRGQAYNFAVPIKNVTTGNRITGGLTGLTASISLDDTGTWASPATPPAEIGTTGWVSVNLSATEMQASRILVQVSVSNSGAVEADAVLQTLNLSQFTGRWDAQSPLRFEQLWLDLFCGMALNGAAQNGAQLQLLNPDGSVHFESVVTQNTTSGSRTKSI